MRSKAVVVLALIAISAAVPGLYLFLHPASSEETWPTLQSGPIDYQPRGFDAPGGFLFHICLDKEPLKDLESLEAIRQRYQDVRADFPRRADDLSRGFAERRIDERLQPLLFKTQIALFNGKPEEAYEVLEKARALVESDRNLAAKSLYTIIFLQGMAGLRRGENENCLECRGDSACIFPLSPSAVHTKPAGSRLAVRHFTEYLERFPDDDGVRWLLNLAYMTLGEHPAKVPPRYLLTLGHFGTECDIGRFRDVSHLVGLTRFNMLGGAIMDDFDNDGLLDVIVSSWEGDQSMAFYRNQGDGTFQDHTEAAGLTNQYAGSNIVQTDYNNDGFLDVFVVRGGWQRTPLRPSLLRNNGNGTFTDVTKKAGLLAPINSMSATWADFDNDGWLDLFICCETGPNLLYRNKHDGTFEEVAERAGVQGRRSHCKGAAWIDYDNDGFPDLFVNYLQDEAQLFHNNRDGTFTDVTEEMGIHGPYAGFSCWAFDYDNDGFLDIFATCYDGDLNDCVRDMQGKLATKRIDHTRLYRNLGGKKFQDVSQETGVDKVFLTMGSNFADFDNDGYLDFYLSTGAPDLPTLVPNRMFKNVGGQRFAEITGTSGTGHLQKGHGVACGDWDRDGNVDLFVELGGAVPGDRYHNVLFQNPGQGNSWLTVKLIGQKTNRAAIGARIKVVTSAAEPLTVHRHVSSGSSFGGNPLQQTIGLGKATSPVTVEVRWPTSGTTQVFRNVAVNQAIEVTEFAEGFRRLNWTRVTVPPT
jgi:hypothetical protein